MSICVVFESSARHMQVFKVKEAACFWRRNSLYIYCILALCHRNGIIELWKWRSALWKRERNKGISWRRFPLLTLSFYCISFLIKTVTSFTELDIKACDIWKWTWWSVLSYMSGNFTTYALTFPVKGELNFWFSHYQSLRTCMSMYRPIRGWFCFDLRTTTATCYCLWQERKEKMSQEYLFISCVYVCT